MVNKGQSFQRNNDSESRILFYFLYTEKKCHWKQQKSFIFIF